MNCIECNMPLETHTLIQLRNCVDLNKSKLNAIRLIKQIQLERQTLITQLTPKDKQS